MTTAEMMRLRADGLSLAEIAARAGLTKSQVSGRLFRCKEPLIRKPIDAAIVQRGKDMLRAGVSQRRVVAQLGVSVYAVARWAMALHEERAAAIEAEMRAGTGAQGDVAPVVPATVQPAPIYSTDNHVAALMARGLRPEEAAYQARLHRARRGAAVHAQA